MTTEQTDARSEVVSVDDGPLIYCGVSDEPLHIATVFDLAPDDEAGAAAVFVGIVRNHDEGQHVASLEYSAHPAAEQRLRGVVRQHASKIRDVRTVVAWHRVGHLAVGDIALIVVVRTPHRREAMIGCSDLVEGIKHQVPIWKRQHFSDGSVAWSNCP